MIFCAREFRFVFPRPSLVMGIVNATPDSFFDGGKFPDANAAAAHALKLVEQGAEILDIGGESTRPGAKPVDEEQECRRVVPVIKKLRSAFQAGKARPTAISIDTMKPAVARAALEAGASIVNDVAANRADDEMWRVVSEFGAGYVLMHAPPGLHGKLRPRTSDAHQGHEPIQSSGVSSHLRSILPLPAGEGGGLPRRSEAKTGEGELFECENPPPVRGKRGGVRGTSAHGNILRETGRFFSERLKKLKASGVAPERVILDPGIGFGKNLEQNLQLLARLGIFTGLRRPLLLGVSRKSFIEKLFGVTVNQRLPASLACAILGIASGANVIRAHDVAETVQAVRMAEAVFSRQRRPRRRQSPSRE